MNPSSTASIAREAMERRRGNRWAKEGENQRENKAVGEAERWLF
jgi:hypothetical protein